MKIEVFRKVDESLRAIRLALVEDGGSVLLHCVDKDGGAITCGVLLSISDDGIRLHEAVNESLGFPLDERGRVKLVE